MAFDVFISHSSKDKTVADAVCAVLESECIRCWVAPRDIQPGQDWGQAIVEAIKNARVMVLILSSNANESPQIKREVERAVSMNIPILPLRIENVLPSSALEYFISTQHWLDAFSPPLDQHLRYMAQVIQKILLAPEKKADPPKTPVITPETIEQALLETPSPLQSELESEPPKTVARTPAWLIGTFIGLIVVLLAIGGWWFGSRPHSRPSLNEKETLSTASKSPPEPSEQSGATPATTSDDGFISLFNGRDLTGWNAQSDGFAVRSDAWSVKDGILNLGPTDAWGNLWYTNEPAHDFELHFRCRFVGEVTKLHGILSVSYRGSTKRVATLQKDQGYFTELSANPHTACAIFQKVVGTGSDFLYPMLAQPSQRRVMHPGDPRRGMDIEERVNTQDDVYNAFKQDWNDVMVRAKGSHISVTVNGILTAELFDEDPENRSAGGVIGLSGHRDLGKSIHGQFKDIRLKRLVDDGTEDIPTGSDLRKPDEKWAPESAFTPIFNGKDLTGWAGDSRVWSVQAGAISGRLEGVPLGDRWLVWQGGSVGDFELRFACFIPTDESTRNGIIGVRFRAHRASEFIAGYTVDLLSTPQQHSTILDVAAPGRRRELALPGKLTVAHEMNGKDITDVIGSLAMTPQALEADYRAGDWNEVAILARGNRLQVRVNGYLLNDCTDENEAKKRLSGALALKLWMNQGPVVAGQFKNLRLRRLPSENDSKK